METSSVRDLTKRWISTAWSCVRERVGLRRLRPRSVKRLVSTISRLITTKDGYYFHVTNSNLGNVPDHFFRKATLKNSERYGTEELAKIEGQMLEARDKSANLEYEIFLRIRQEVEKYIGRLQKLARTIATIDVLQAFAVVAEQQHLVCPRFTDQRETDH